MSMNMPIANVNANVNKKCRRNVNEYVNRNVNKHVNRNANEKVGQNVNKNAYRNANEHVNRTVTRNVSREPNDFFAFYIFGRWGSFEVSNLMKFPKKSMKFLELSR